MGLTDVDSNVSDAGGILSESYPLLNNNNIIWPILEISADAGKFLNVMYANHICLQLLHWLLARETTLQHDMARKIGLHFLLEEGWNFEIYLLCVLKSKIKAGNNKF